mgnify:CR=1 FL=1
MKKKFITFGRPCIDKKEINFVTKVIKSKWIGSGPVTERFEKNFRKYKKSKYSLAVNSCTAALHLSLLYSGIKPNDEVITTPMTFVSTINSIVLTGAKPVLADINLNTFNIDPNELIKKITKKTRALIVVHIGGLPCEMDKIVKICKIHNIKLIEDCAHAIEGKYKNVHVGNFGVTGCYSFYSTKNLTTGEGGMITCQNENIYKRLRVARLHGLSKDAWMRFLPEGVKSKKFSHYDVTEIGLKYNMIDINAAMGIIQLKKLEKNWKRRRFLYNIYKKKLSHLPFHFQKFDERIVKHAYHLMLIVLDKNRTKKNRDDLISYLGKNKIGCGVNYRSVTDMTVFRKKYKWNNKTCIKSKYIGDNTISLPLYPDLKIKDQNYICSKIEKYFQI